LDWKRSSFAAVSASLIALLVGACGDTPIQPSPNPGGGGQNTTPPPNNPPVVESITIKGSRPNEPANFADLGEAINVSAKVRDDETAIDQLQYTWSATAGTFSGTGANVTWTAPATLLSTPTGPVGQTVTVTLTLVERYGTAPSQFEHRVTGSATLLLHDSPTEVGDMAWQFLMDFSDSSIRDVAYIMRNYSRARCPQPSEVDLEYEDVTRDRERFRRTSYSVTRVKASVNFRGVCPYGLKRGDACAVVPVVWADIFLPTNTPGLTRGDDIVAAAYSPDDGRWWLCASSYQAFTTVGASHYR
jgi:hypothetical protein